MPEEPQVSGQGFGSQVNEPAFGPANPLQPASGKANTPTLLPWSPVCETQPKTASATCAVSKPLRACRACSAAKLVAERPLAQ